MARKRWFQTWKRPEYLEWAIPIEGGYVLVIIRKEKRQFLCVRAKLLFVDEGLPSFTMLDEIRFPRRQQALRQIASWEEAV